jgi:hypothetical protein
MPFHAPINRKFFLSLLCDAFESIHLRRAIRGRPIQLPATGGLAASQTRGKSSPAHKAMLHAAKAIGGTALDLITSAGENRMV